MSEITYHRVIDHKLKRKSPETAGIHREIQGNAGNNGELQRITRLAGIVVRQRKLIQSCMNRTVII
jgi:hypothetical protein